MSRWNVRIPLQNRPLARIQQTRKSAGEILFVKRINTQYTIRLTKRVSAMLRQQYWHTKCQRLDYDIRTYIRKRRDYNCSSPPDSGFQQNSIQRGFYMNVLRHAIRL